MFYSLFNKCVRKNKYFYKIVVYNLRKKFIKNVGIYKAFALYKYNLININNAFFKKPLLYNFSYNWNYKFVNLLILNFMLGNIDVYKYFIKIKLLKKVIKQFY